MRTIPPRRLLFSGGGIRVVSYLGALQVLQENNLLKHVREFCGVSAGALVSLMLALEYRFHVIERFCYEFDFSTMHGFEIETILESMEQFGLNSGENVKGLLKKILHHKGFGPDTTFGELNASGKAKKLRVWASDIQYLKLIEFSAEKTPNMSIVNALYASMALPVYFTPVLHSETKTLLLDGGILDNYPISTLTETEIEETLGFTFEHSKFPIDVQDISSLLSLIFAGYYMPCYQKQIEKYKSRTIVLPCQEFPSTEFNISMEDRQRLVSVGRQAAENFLKSPKLEYAIKRRNSVS